MQEEKSTDKSELGKKSRAKGQRFEAKVRQNLEELGWTVSKWMNTIEKNKIVFHHCNITIDRKRYQYYRA